MKKPREKEKYRIFSSMTNAQSPIKSLMFVYTRINSEILFLDRIIVNGHDDVIELDVL